MITLQKIHTNDLVTDNSGTWSDEPESAFVVGREEGSNRFELLWADGVHSFEKLSQLSAPGWSVHCTHAPCNHPA